MPSLQRRASVCASPHLGAAEGLELRVIAGQLGGRRLRPPPLRGARSGIRPTSERVREAIFSSLGDVEHARVLDLYAGSGALGIEALSRGAQHAVFVESAVECVVVLRSNLKQLAVEASARVIHADALEAIRSLGRQGERFDLAFLDPPYESGEVERSLPALQASGVLAQGALLVVEGSRRHVLPAFPGLALLDQKRYGDTLVSRLTVCGPQLQGGTSGA